LTRIKYDNRTQIPQLTTISESHSISDDKFIDDDGWKFYDGPFDGDRIPNDEDHGICTQDDMLPLMPWRWLPPILFPLELLR
jgi:hypothetical protein